MDFKINLERGKWRVSKMKFAKLIVIGLVLIGVSFSYTSSFVKTPVVKAKPLTKNEYWDKNAYWMGFSQLDANYHQYLLAERQKNPTVMGNLLFGAPAAASSAVASPAVASPASAASVVTPVEEGLDDQKTWFWGGGKPVATDSSVASPVSRPSVGTTIEDDVEDESAWYYGSQPVATDSAPVSRPSVDTTREEGAGNGWFWSGQDADGAAVGETDPELDSFDIMRMSGPKGRRPRTQFKSVDSILAGQDVSSEPTSLVFGNDMDNLVYLENALFDNNYERLIAMTQAEKLALFQSRAGSEDPRAALLAELQNKFGPLRYSPSTSPRVVAIGASSVVSGDGDDSDDLIDLTGDGMSARSVVSGDGDDSDVFGDFIAAVPPRVEKAVNLVRLEEDLHTLGVEYSVYSNQTLDDKLRSKTTLLEKDLEL